MHARRLRNGVIVACSVLLIAVAWATPAWAAAGDLDHSFSGDGNLLLRFGQGQNDLTDVAVRSDGRIVVVGTGTHGGRVVFEVARLLANGRLDRSFGHLGRAYLSFPGRVPTGEFLPFTPKVALQPDGGIVVAGTVSPPTKNGKHDIALARLTAAGRLDPSFGDGGRVVTNLGPGDDDANDVEVDEHGRIVVAGTADSGGVNHMVVLRYLPSGALDHGFAGTGVRVVPSQTDAVGEALALAGDRVLTCGAVDDKRFLVARLTPTGAMDPTFGVRGRVTIAFQHLSICLSLAITPEGRIVAGGLTSVHDSLDQHLSMALARLGSNGVLDGSFGTHGEVVENTGGGDLLNAIAVQPDGRIVTAGSSDTQNYLIGKHLEVARFTRAGALDPTFNTVGVTGEDLGPSNETLAAVAVAGNRATVAGLVVTTNQQFGHAVGAVVRYLLS